MTQPLLEIRGVSMSFGGVKAVHDVSLSIQPGERVAIIGPNGAGKTTLVNCIAGGLSPGSGDILFQGESIRNLSAAARARRGIARTFQNLELFLSMTVLDNVLAAIDGQSGRLSLPTASRASATRQRALDALALLRIENYADVPAGALPYGVRKLVELSRALVTEPRLLLLDEPVAGLTDTDEFLGTLVEGLVHLGSGVLLIEHDMPTVQRICDTVHVLDSGRLIASGTYAQVSRHPQVIEAYLGVGHRDVRGNSGTTPSA